LAARPLEGAAVPEFIVTVMGKGAGYGTLGGLAGSPWYKCMVESWKFLIALLGVFTGSTSGLRLIVFPETMDP
jgi:hypothetical protein